MKNIFIGVTIVLPLFTAAQLKTSPVCPPLTVDLLAGKINSLTASASMGEVKKQFPCYTSFIDTSVKGCNKVEFKDRGLRFFTDRNYFEIERGFKGAVVPALMNMHRSKLFSIIGNPKLKDPSWEAYQTQFGTLVLYFDKAGKVNKLQVSSKSMDILKLCD